MRYYCSSKSSWEKVLAELTSSYAIYAPLKNFISQDYELIDEYNIRQIIYNTPKPVTPLKMFFLPVRQNVAREITGSLKRIIIGTPSCDLAALDLLDAIYLDATYPDHIYKANRENTTIVAADCFDFQEHCHCTSYGVNPFPERNCDITIFVIKDNVYLSPLSEKGEKLISLIKRSITLEQIRDTEIETLKLKRIYIKVELDRKNEHIPELSKSNELVKEAEQWLWKKHAKSCVSCGACATICPTCTCFLLIDRPDFDKVRQVDACQYPGFERVAAGEDPLIELFSRFRNRYLCKYVWKPDRFKLKACTGCGRCIETCIGKIDKNTVLREMAVQKI
jgi:sulfhydrogenase subunit beta (sulfur reductase)